MWGAVAVAGCCRLLLVRCAKPRKSRISTSAGDDFDITFHSGWARRRFANLVVQARVHALPVATGKARVFVDGRLCNVEEVALLNALLRSGALQGTVAARGIDSRVERGACAALPPGAAIWPTSGGVPGFAGFVGIERASAAAGDLMPGRVSGPLPFGALCALAALAIVLVAVVDDLAGRTAALAVHTESSIAVVGAAIPGFWDCRAFSPVACFPMSV